jgi:hypothetical protein
MNDTMDSRNESVVDFGNLARQLCPYLFVASPESPNERVPRPSVCLVRMTFCYMDETITLKPHAYNNICCGQATGHVTSNDALQRTTVLQGGVGEPNTNNSKPIASAFTCTASTESIYFDTTPHGFAKVHIRAEYPSFEVPMGIMTRKNGSNGLSGRESRGKLCTMLLNVFVDNLPWRHLPYHSPLVEYIALVSSAGLCKELCMSTMFRDQHLHSNIACDGTMKYHDVQYVLHAWVAARVLPSTDARYPWSAYRCLGSIFLRMQYTRYKKLSLAYARHAHRRLSNFLVCTYAAERHNECETDSNLLSRIIWTPALRALLQFEARCITTMDKSAFQNALQYITVPVGWASTQIQMEISQQQADYGWQWGVLLMGLGCSNLIIPRVPIASLSSFNVSIQWGDALYGSDRFLTVLNALCDCPELLWQRSTGTMLLHWAWKQDWQKPCATSPKGQSVDVLRHLTPAICTVHDSPSYNALVASQQYHLNLWTDYMCSFYGNLLVDFSNLREQLCDTLHQFRAHCELQWTKLQLDGVLSTYAEPHRLPSSSSSVIPTSSTTLQSFERHVDSDVSQASTSTMPLALSISTHSWRMLWPRLAGRVGYWYLWLPHGNAGQLPIYGYNPKPTVAKTLSRSDLVALVSRSFANHDSFGGNSLFDNTFEASMVANNPDQLDWSNGCGMSPLLQIQYPFAINSPEYGLRNMPHEHCYLTDLQQWFQLWYCAKIMTKHISLPYDVHQGPSFGNGYWTYVSSLFHNSSCFTTTIGVVPSKDLVYSVRTELSPFDVFDVTSLQQALSMKTLTTNTTLCLVILYGHWWTLDHWHKLMQTMDIICTTHRHKRQSSATSSSTTLAKINVRLHIVGTMWLSCMDQRVHQAIWPQLYYCQHARRSTINMNSDSRGFSDSRSSSSSSDVLNKDPFSAPHINNSLLDLFCISYARENIPNVWTMPTAGFPMRDHMMTIFNYMKWLPKATSVSVDAREQFIGESLSTSPTLLESRLLDGPAVDITNDDLSKTQGAKSLFGILLDNLQTATRSDGSLADELSTKAYLQNESSLSPKTLMLLSAPLRNNSLTLTMVRDVYPFSEELKTVSKNPNSLYCLQLRVWLRRHSIHVILQHHRHVDARLLQKMVPVCWCDTPYSSHLCCGELFIDPSLMLHTTDVFASVSELWMCSSTNDALYCRTMAHGKNGHKGAGVSDNKRTIAWMRLADPLPLLDTKSLAHFERFLSCNHLFYSNQRLHARMANFIPIAQEYTSTSAEDVVLFVLPSSSIQSIWAAMQLARTSFTMVGIDFRGNPIPIVDMITHCRPLRSPADGLWLQYAMDHALRCRSRTRVMPAALEDVSASAANVRGDYSSTEKRKPGSIQTLESKSLGSVRFIL